MGEADGRSVELDQFAAEELDEELAGPPIAALSLRHADEPRGAALITRLAAAPALPGSRSLTLEACSLGHEAVRPRDCQELMASGLARGRET